MTMLRRICVSGALLIIGFLVVLYFIYFRPNEAVLVPIEPAGSAPLAVGSPAFLKTLSEMTGTPVKNGEPVTPIENGHDFESALLGAIGDATSSIFITDYAWNEGTFSHQVFSALTAAAQRGVAVRVVLDGFGGKKIPGQWVDGLAAAGGEAVYYHPFQVIDPFAYNIRDHARIFVVDNTVGFTGGMGLVDYWTGSAEGFSTWRDLMFEVHGSMAADLGLDFARLWQGSTSTSMGIPTGNVAETESIASNTPSYLAFPDVPSGSFEPIHDAFLMTVLGAQKRLYIESPFIVPDRDVVDALEAKAKAGVDVRIISTGPITIAPILRTAWHGYYAELLAAGVKLYEYQPSMIHSKIMVADDTWSLFGSANVDDRSESINAESVIGVSDPKLAGKLDHIFATDLANSKQISLSDWSSQFGILEHVSSAFWLLFTRQL